MRSPFREYISSHGEHYACLAYSLFRNILKRIAFAKGNWPESVVQRILLKILLLDAVANANTATSTVSAAIAPPTAG